MSACQSLPAAQLHMLLEEHQLLSDALIRGVLDLNQLGVPWPLAMSLSSRVRGCRGTSAWLYTMDVRCHAWHPYLAFAVVRRLRRSVLKSIQSRHAADSSMVSQSPHALAVCLCRAQGPSACRPHAAAARALCCSCCAGRPGRGAAGRAPAPTRPGSTGPRTGSPQHCLQGRTGDEKHRITPTASCRPPALIQAQWILPGPAAHCQRSDRVLDGLHPDWCERVHHLLYPE